MEYYPAEKLIVPCGATGGISPPWRSSFNLDACYYLDPGPLDPLSHGNGLIQ